MHGTGGCQSSWTGSQRSSSTSSRTTRQPMGGPISAVRSNQVVRAGRLPRPDDTPTIRGIRARAVPRGPRRHHECQAGRPTHLRRRRGRASCGGGLRSGARRGDRSPAFIAFGGHGPHDGLKRRVSVPRRTAFTEASANRHGPKVLLGSTLSSLAGACHPGCARPRGASLWTGNERCGAAAVLCPLFRSRAIEGTHRCSSDACPYWPLPWG